MRASYHGFKPAATVFANGKQCIVRTFDVEFSTVYVVWRAFRTSILQG